jgi:hypothetical protein
MYMQFYILDVATLLVWIIHILSQANRAIIRLPHLDRLRMANLRQITSVTHEARVINVKEGRASPLRSLELENCPLDGSWLQSLTHLPNLE